jgi:hypothetical protein
LFNAAGLVIGHLTGGGSCCVVNGCPAGSTGTGPTLADDYGKVSYDWTSDGATSGVQLKPWLDPGNSGVTSLAGVLSCSAAAVNEHTLDNNVNVYPNPGNGSFNVNIDLDKADDVFIRVLNVIGQEILARQIANTQGGIYPVNLDNQSAGTYFIEIKTKDARVVRKINLIR